MNRHRIDWERATTAVPTMSAPKFDDPNELPFELQDFVHCVESGYYLHWDAAIRSEQRLPLTARQQAALDELITFGDSDSVLYVDGMPRPDEPWYHTLNRLARGLVLQPPVDLTEVGDFVWLDGWPRVEAALEDHAAHLEMPAGVGDPIEVVPQKIRSRLGIQSCYPALLGLDGQDISLVSQPPRVAQFLEALEEHLLDLEVLGLSPTDLLDELVLFPQDRAVLGGALQQLAKSEPSSPSPLA